MNVQYRQKALTMKHLSIKGGPPYLSTSIRIIKMDLGESKMKPIVNPRLNQRKKFKVGIIMVKLTRMA